jgi:hypothetical protein
MNIRNIKAWHAMVAMLFAITFIGCQKMDRPELGEPVLDPPPPPYSTLKNFFAFEDNPGDSGQFRMNVKAENVSYVTGVNGKAAQIGADGYILQQAVNDSLKTPGSLTVAFWMNGVGPVTGGAQGLFSLSHGKEFWGNFDMFLENLDTDEAFLKIHQFNKNAADGKGEEWSEVKLPGALNKWTHIAVTYNAATSELSIYQDGAPSPLYKKVLGGGNYGNLSLGDVNGMVIGTYQFQPDPSLTTGGGKQDWARSFNGALDQFRVYNVALSDAEVMALYNNEE